MLSQTKTYNLNHINIEKYKCIKDFSEFNKNNKSNKESKIIAKKFTYNDKEYAIIKYDRNNLIKDEYSTLGLARSIVIYNNKIVCFSPPKSIDYNEFIGQYSCDESYAEDFIDGTMINVFYNDSEWEVATKSTIGANNQFFVNNENDKRYSFREMFFDACNISNININNLNTEYSYSFVLQHPNNRIVTPIDFPKVFLIRVYRIDNLSNIVEEISNEIIFNTIPALHNTGILYPQRYSIDNYENLSSYYNNEQTPFYCMGVIIYSNKPDSNCSRTKIRNKNYENIRELRGNQSRLQYHYLTLRNNGRVKNFLTFYGEFAPYFTEYRNTIHEYTNNLYINYISCYIRKEKQLKLFPYEFKVHMFNIHQNYLKEIKPNRGYIDKKYVIDYFNGLHPSQQMHILNCKKKYNLREKSEKVDSNMDTEEIESVN